MVSSTGLVAPASNSPAVKPALDVVPAGLTNEEARTRLEKDGPNAMPDTSAHPLRNALAKFWAPVPWLLEASVVLEIVLHKYYEAAVIALCSFSTQRSPTSRKVALKPPSLLSNPAWHLMPLSIATAYGRLYLQRNWYVATS